MSERGSSRGGCLGCFAVLALVIAVVIGAMYALLPATISNTVKAYAQRAIESLGVVETVHESEDSLGYVGKTLNERQQQTYLQLIEGIHNFDKTIVVLDSSAEDVERAYAAMMDDHPELFWLSGSYTYITPESLRSVSVEPGLEIDPSEIEQTRQQIEAVADEVLASIGDNPSQYDIAEGVYAYIASTTDYVADAPHNQTIQSVLLNHQSVCAGYSRTYQYLLQRAGVQCAYVEGTISSTKEDHAWNMITVDGVNAYVDPTWADPAYSGEDTNGLVGPVSYDYLGLTTAEIERDDHVFSNRDIWPVCDSVDLDYYRRHGLFLEGYDEAAVSDLFWSQRQLDETFSAMKFGSSEAYAAARDALLNGRCADVRFSYAVTSDSLYILKLYG